MPLDYSGGQIADYIARVVSWYTAGGFTDEFGIFHKSNFHLNISQFEVYIYILLFISLL